MTHTQCLPVVITDGYHFEFVPSISQQIRSDLCIYLLIIFDLGLIRYPDQDLLKKVSGWDKDERLFHLEKGLRACPYRVALLGQPSESPIKTSLLSESHKYEETTPSKIFLQSIESIYVQASAHAFILQHIGSVCQLRIDTVRVGIERIYLGFIEFDL